MSTTYCGLAAYELVRRLSVDVGARVAGTEGDHRAGKLIREYFQDLGMKVSEQSFPVEYRTLDERRIEVLEPNLGEIPAWGQTCSNQTPPEGVTGDLVFVEGYSEPVAGPEVEGKIVLWGSTRKSSLEVRNLYRYGPLAVIGIWPFPATDLKQMDGMPRMVEPFEMAPTFWIRWEDGLRLLNSDARRVRVTLRWQGHASTSSNIIADLTGSMAPDEFILIGGHRDTQPDLPGAVDNASGTATAMELARVFAAKGSRRTLRFIGWGGEEAGWVGSRYYAHQLLDTARAQRASPGFHPERDRTDLERHLLCITFDCVGTKLGHNACDVLGPPELMNAVKLLGDEMGLNQQVMEEFYGSDHQPFAWAGVPSVNMAREGGAAMLIHSVDDSIGLIDRKHLAEVGTLAQELISRLDASRKWPFHWQPTSETKNTLHHNMEWWEKLPEQHKGEA